MQPSPKSHRTPECAAVALQGTILRTRVGSEIHGLATTDSDIDEMGVCIPPANYVAGLDQFEQYQERSQPDGVRSGAGDMDATIYSLRKWAYLASQGNPTVLMLAFVPDEFMIDITDAGRRLQAKRELFVSRRAASKFRGYLRGQRDQMLGVKGRKHTNRPELVEKYGYDTKFAYHAVRLGMQGMELLETGSVTLPMVEDERSFLAGLRRGEVSKEEALQMMDFYLADLHRIESNGKLRDEPDMEAINAWLVREHLDHWGWPITKQLYPLR